MTSESLKIAKINRQIALMETIKQVTVNPAVELIVGLKVLDGMYPEGKKNTLVTTMPSPINPIGIIKNFFGVGQELKVEQYTENTSTAEEWARQALLWVIIAQQLAPYVPSIVQGATNSLTGIAGIAGSVLTKGATK